MARASGRRRVASGIIALSVLGGGTWLVIRSADDLGSSVGRLGVGAVATSGVLAALGTLLIGRVWSCLLHGLGVSVPQVDAGAVFFVTQLGKYIPGSVWPVVAQMEFGRTWGAARRTMLAANMLMISVLAVTGLVLGGLLLPWSAGDAIGTYAWLLLALTPLVVTLHPRVIPGLLDWALGMVGREPLSVSLSGRAMIQATLWSLSVWLVMGLHVLVLMWALGADGADAVALAMGGMALGWAAGLIFIPAPAGAGVRDALLVAAVGSEIGTAPALAVALTSRVLLLVVDVLLASLGALLRLVQTAASRR